MKAQYRESNMQIKVHPAVDSYPEKIMPAKLALINVANAPQIQAEIASLAKSPLLLGESCP